MAAPPSGGRAPAASPNSLLGLPADIHFGVLQYLPPLELIACTASCRYLRDFGREHDELLWKRLYARMFPCPAEALETPDSPTANDAAGAAGVADCCGSSGGTACHGADAAPEQVESAQFSARCRRLRLHHTQVDIAPRYRPLTWRHEVELNLRYVPDRCHQVLRHHGDEVWICQWSPDGRLLASGSKEGSWALFELVLIADPAAPALRPALVVSQQGSLSGSVAMVDWSPDSRRLLFSLTSNEVVCYDVVHHNTVDPVVECKDFDCYARWYNTTDFICGGERSRLAPGGSAWHKLKRLRVQLEQGKERVCYVDAAKYHFQPANTIHCPMMMRRHSLGPDATYVVFMTGGLWNGQNWRVGAAPLSNGSLRPAPQGPAGGLHWPTQEATVAVDAPAGSSPLGNGSRLIEEATPALCSELGPPLGSTVGSAGRHILLNVRPFRDQSAKPSETVYNDVHVLSNELVMHLWNLDAGRIEHSYRGHKGFSSDAAPFLSWPHISPFSPHIATGSEDNHVYVYNLNHEDCVRRLGADSGVGHSMLVNCVAYHPLVPSLLASCADDHEIRLWGVADHERLLQAEWTDARAFWYSLPRRAPRSSRSAQRGRSASRSSVSTESVLPADHSAAQSPSTPGGPPPAPMS
eukprot:TRINITY_DN71817_c0_g1_i1.p1 TRINITY_DN71817_c0_g1~~TRINITY_DN71817_c0_g1_i1.p1  ORF type:complete len:660 (+),score=175.59 TRINITY_DN71817_c0_g1_i1:70-1980(+)